MKYLIGWYLFCLVFGLVGWIANLVKLLNMTETFPDKMFILRCIGLPFPPIGIVLGYMR